MAYELVQGHDRHSINDTSLPFLFFIFHLWIMMFILSGARGVELRGSWKAGFPQYPPKHQCRDEIHQHIVPLAKEPKLLCWQSGAGDHRRSELEWVVETSTPLWLLGFIRHVHSSQLVVVARGSILGLHLGAESSVIN